MSSIKAGAPYVDNMYVLTENSGEDYANSYAEIRNYLPSGVKRHGNFCDGGTRICMVKTCFSRFQLTSFVYCNFTRKFLNKLDSTLLCSHLAVMNHRYMENGNLQSLVTGPQT